MNLKEKYAKLIVEAGLNVQKDQIVVVRADDIEMVDFVRLVTLAAFNAGAKDVIVQYKDSVVNKYRYNSGNRTVYEYEALFLNETANKGACYLSLVGADPDAMKGIDPKLLSSYSKELRGKTTDYRNKLDYLESQWCVASVPTLAWAKKVYPDCEDALDKLWDAVLKVSRIDENDVIENWNIHRKSFEKRVNILNKLDIASVHYTNSLGTDLVVELPENYIFAGGGSYLKNGVYYFPNIPTEEIFSAPKKTGVNGKLYSAMPLSHNGSLVKDFWLEFKDGKVVNYDAKEGKSVLESIMDTDEGAKYLGEIALVPYGSPISSLHTLFYETLIDENASCHFALGASYNECIEGGLEMNEEELLEHGMNQSFAHVDFMVGTSDLKIEATLKNGQTLMIFEDGKFTLSFDELSFS
jgi:aminopeptidase